MKYLPKNPRLLNVSKAAKKLGVCINTLRLWEEKGILVPLRTTGRQRRYTLAQIYAFQESHKKENKLQKSTNLAIHPLQHPTTSESLFPSQGTLLQFFSILHIQFSNVILTQTDRFMTKLAMLSDVLTLHARSSRKHIGSTQLGYIALGTLTSLSFPTVHHLNRNIHAFEKAIVDTLDQELGLLLWVVNLFLDGLIILPKILFFFVQLILQACHLLYIILMVTLYSAFHQRRFT